MSIRSIIFYPAYVVSCLLVLPLLALAGTMALMGYAVISEFRELIFGPSKESPDNRTAREMAHRMCTGH
jgi:hypothetical protein